MRLSVFIISLLFCHCISSAQLSTYIKQTRQTQKSRVRSCREKYITEIKDRRHFKQCKESARIEYKESIGRGKKWVAEGFPFYKVEYRGEGRAEVNAYLNVYIGNKRGHKKVFFSHEFWLTASKKYPDFMAAILSIVPATDTSYKDPYYFGPGMDKTLPGFDMGVIGNRGKEYFIADVPGHRNLLKKVNDSIADPVSISLGYSAFIKDFSYLIKILTRQGNANRLSINKVFFDTYLQ